MRLILCLLALFAVDAPAGAHESRAYETTDETEVESSRSSRPRAVRARPAENAVLVAQRRRVMRRPWEWARRAVHLDAASSLTPPLRAPPARP
jgi:hypothetical protein